MKKETGRIIYAGSIEEQVYKTHQAVIKGKTDPEDGFLSVKSATANFDKQIAIEDGEFEIEVPLPDTANYYDVSLTSEANNSPTLHQDILVLHREPNALELVEIEKQKKAAVARRQANRQRELAEERRWYQTRAGHINKKHPEWSKEDCQNIADRKIWIGMEYSMLKYMRGLPDHANPSNYGRVTQWQWCWNDYTPSCFYDRDEDGLIDAYN